RNLSCAAVRSDPRVKSVKFPKDSILRRKWEQAVKRKGFVATDWSVLCSEHFNADDFDRTGQIVRLRQGVKPSVFNFPSYLQKVQTVGKNVGQLHQ
uniref:THAP-type domain-containing protein n=1 Tax=Gouania willdenowi TaxID=441366 RepID=A0A8C5G3L7_GOUWI